MNSGQSLAPCGCSLQDAVAWVACRIASLFRSSNIIHFFIICTIALSALQFLFKLMTSSHYPNYDYHDHYHIHIITRYSSSYSYSNNSNSIYLAACVRACVFERACATCRACSYDFHSFIENRRDLCLAYNCTKKL